MTTLTAREQEVLSLMAEGRSNQAIADRLSVGAGTVEKHVTSIFGKARTRRLRSPITAEFWRCSHICRARRKYVITVEHLCCGAPSRPSDD